MPISQKIWKVQKRNLINRHFVEHLAEWGQTFRECCGFTPSRVPMRALCGNRGEKMERDPTFTPIVTTNNNYCVRAKKSIQQYSDLRLPPPPAPSICTATVGEIWRENLNVEWWQRSANSASAPTSSVHPHCGMERTKTLASARSHCPTR